MKEKLDILLVNSIAPRQRIASDAALENGLAILRTYLEDEGFSVDVVDDQRIASVEEGVPSWCLSLLRNLVHLQMKIYPRRFVYLWWLIMLLTWPVQSLALYCRRVHARRRIEDIVKMIKERHIDFLGVKVWYGDAFTWSNLLASRVRETCPQTVVVAGGPHVKVYGEEFLVNSDFELAIMGAGEETLAEMISLRRHTKDKQAFLAVFYQRNGGSGLIKRGVYNEGAAGGNITFPTPRYRAVDLEGKIYFHTLVDGFGCS